MARTRLAKTIYWIAGTLARIKTPQRTYRITSFEPLTTEYAGRRWGAWSWSMKLLKLSARVDPDHWAHWALQHTDKCSGGLCGACGGTLCLERSVEEGIPS